MGLRILLPSNWRFAEHEYGPRASVGEYARLLRGNKFVSDSAPADFASEHRKGEIEEKQVGNHRGEHNINPGLRRNLGARGRDNFGSRDEANCSAKDRKSTRLNSSHVRISYAVFCLKKKTK